MTPTSPPGDDGAVAAHPAGIHRTRCRDLPRCPFRDARGEFLRDAAGSLAWLRFGGRIHRRE
jgi:hypothetical protein